MRTTRLLTGLIAISLASCAGVDELNTNINTGRVCELGEISDFDPDMVVTDKGEIAPELTGKCLDMTYNDLGSMNDTLFSFTLEPMSAAEGKSISGNVSYTYDTIGRMTSAIVYSSDHKHVYIWPDKLAAHANGGMIDNTILVDQLLEKTVGHSKWHVAYMSNPGTDGAQKLELLHPGSIYMLGENDCPDSKERFDLSGLTMHNGKIYSVSDKKITDNIYTLDTCSDGKFYIQIVHNAPLIKTNDIDLEAIDFYGDKMVLSDEVNNLVYIENDYGDFDLMPVYLDKIDTDLSTWGAANCGAEGLAIDNAHSLMYIGKEREPRRIVVYNIKTQELSTPYDDVVLPNDGDISDLSYENGYLYILDRANCEIRRLDLKTKESVFASFHDFSNNFKDNNYVADFGMAEAMMLTKDAIFIGFDNNGDPVSDYGATLGMEKGSTKPCIMVFKRPEGF